MSDAPQGPASTTPPTTGTGPDAPPAPPAEASSGGRGWIWLIVLAVLGAGGWYGYQRWMAPQAQVAAGDAPASADGKADGKADAAAADKKADKKGKGAGRGGVTPVVALPARTAPLNVYLTGLGTVTPLRSVTLKSRVDGQLVRVHFQEGQMVERGQLLAEIDPRPFEVARMQAEGQLARDQALLANARLDLERYRTLLEQDSIAKQQVDAQAALVAQYEGIVRADQAQLENARLQLAYSRIESPIAGRAGLRLVDPGNIVRSGDAAGLMVITQTAPIAVSFTIPQDNLPALLARMQEEEAVPVEAWDRDQTKRIATGRLLAVDNQVDTTTGTVRLKAGFANRDETLFPNQFVNVRLRLDTLKDATVIPAAAVQRGSQGMFVYVVKEDNTVTARPVKLGPIDGARVAIDAGVVPGEMVVIDGIDRLREGAPVQITKRPEFKPSVDGSTPAKKGQRRRPPGEEGKGAPGAAPDKAGLVPGKGPAAEGGEARKGPPGEGGEARKGSGRRPDDAGAAAGGEPAKGARGPRGEGAAAGDGEPRKGMRRGGEGSGEAAGGARRSGGDDAKGQRSAQKGGDPSKGGRRADKGEAVPGKGGGRPLSTDGPGSETFRVQTEPYAPGTVPGRPAGTTPRKGKPETRPETAPAAPGAAPPAAPAGNAPTPAE